MHTKTHTIQSYFLRYSPKRIPVCEIHQENKAGQLILFIITNLCLILSTSLSSSSLNLRIIASSTGVCKFMYWATCKQNSNQIYCINFTFFPILYTTRIFCHALSQSQYFTFNTVSIYLISDDNQRYLYGCMGLY